MTPVNGKRYDIAIQGVNFESLSIAVRGAERTGWNPAQGSTGPEVLGQQVGVSETPSQIFKAPYP